MALRSLAIVDDSEAELLLARIALRRSRLACQLHALQGGGAFHGFVADLEPSDAPEVVLLDVNMPGETGFDVLARTRGDPVWTESTRFIMFTNSDNPADRRRAGELGAGYQVKPLSLEAYVAWFDTFDRS